MTEPTRSPDPDREPAPEESELVAYLDGELTDEAARALEQKLAADPQTRTQADAFKKSFDLLDHLPTPEPSTTFATRTLTQIVSAPPGSMFRISSLFTRRVGLVVAASLVVALISAAVGLAVRSSRVQDVALTPDLLPVLARLPLYAGVDELEYLRKLDHPDLFGDDPTSLSPNPVVQLDRPLSADDQTRLFEQFKAMPETRRQQIIRLDQDFRELSPVDKDRLGRVLERYAVWLDRLPDGYRRDVLNARTPDDRIRTVEVTQVKEWQDALPSEKRAKLRMTTGEDQKAAMLLEWQEAEQTRRQDWMLAARQWQSLKEGKKPWPFDDAKLRAAVDQFVKLAWKPDGPESRLTVDEARRLNFFRVQTENDRAWFQYGALLLDLAERHPYLPEPKSGTPITSFEQLPAKFQLEARPRNNPPQTRLKPLIGKWPDFALAIVAEAKSQRVSLPDPPLGPCKPGEFLPPVEEFIASLAPNYQQELKRLEGRWPEYPRKVIDIARVLDQSIPGVTLPGKPSEWTRYYRYQRPKSEKPGSRTPAN